MIYNPFVTPNRVKVQKHNAYKSSHKMKKIHYSESKKRLEYRIKESVNKTRGKRSLLKTLSWF